MKLQYREQGMGIGENRAKEIGTLGVDRSQALV